MGLHFVSPSYCCIIFENWYKMQGKRILIRLTKVQTCEFKKIRNNLRKTLSYDLGMNTKILALRISKVLNV